MSMPISRTILADSGFQQRKARRSSLVARTLARFSYVECGDLGRGEWVLLLPTDVWNAAE